MSRAAVEPAEVIAVIPLRESDLAPEAEMPLLRGRPLLAYTIEAARVARTVGRILLSTDSERLARLGEQLGVDCPFIRPPALSAPDVPLNAVLKHALQWLAEHQPPRPRVVVLLEMSHPIRLPGLIDQVVETLIDQDLDTVFTAYEDHHQFWRIDDAGDLQPVGGEEFSTRATRPALYREASGLACANRAEVILRGQRFGRKLGLVPVRHPSALVDTQDPMGLILAERLLDEQAMAPALRRE